MTTGPHGLHVLDHPGDIQGDRPTVFLVHGSLDRATSFARVVRRLHGLHVVSYDRRGYNGSRQVLPLATSLDDHVRDLVDLVGSLSSGQAVVVGHSFGGDVALGAALVDPDRICAVAAYEPPLSWLEWWPRRAGNAEQDPAQFAEAFFRRITGDGSWERLGEHAREERRADGPALMAELSALRGTTAPFDLGALAVPAVVGRGESSVWHHRRAIDELAQTIPDVRVVEIEGAAHGAHLTHPGAFADLVRLTVSLAPEGGSVQPRM